MCVLRDTLTKAIGYMISLLSGAGQLCLSVLGFILISAGGLASWKASNGDYVLTFAGTVGAFIVAGAILGPLAALYRISDDMHEIRNRLSS
jgi:hypothetical protein